MSLLSCPWSKQFFRGENLHLPDHHGTVVLLREEITGALPMFMWVGVTSGGLFSNSASIYPDGVLYSRVRDFSFWRRVFVVFLSKSNPIIGLDRPWRFQKVEAPRFQDIRHMKVVRLSAIRTCRLYPPGSIPGTHFC